MKFGVAFNTAYFGTDPEVIAGYAQHAEACGFESFYMSEHVALYKGAQLGGAAIDPTVAIVDPLEVLAFVAARTERILLGTAILQLPLHHPVMLAKRVATIDVLSKGRMRLLTIGLGSLAGESAAMGVDHATRGRRADEEIDILRLLWAGDENGVSFDTVVTEVERDLLLKSLRKTGGNKMQAARLLNMKRTTFVEKLKRLGISEGEIISGYAVNE